MTITAIETENNGIEAIIPENVYSNKSKENSKKLKPAL